MKKQKKQQQYELDQFEEYSNLWTIIPCGSGRSIELLRKIVDSIQADNYSNPGRRMPAVLTTGFTRDLVAKAFINSLQITDVRECPSHFLDNGVSSSQLFDDSLTSTAHYITDIENLTTIGKSVIWKYLKYRQCQYYNYQRRNYSKIVHCNGLIVLTANKADNVSESILNQVDYSVKTEPYSVDQLRQFANQQLEFCGISYKGQAVIDEIVKVYPKDITDFIRLIKTCVLLLEAELSNRLTVKIVREAKRLCSVPAPVNHQDNDTLF